MSVMHENVNLWTVHGFSTNLSPSVNKAFVDTVLRWQVCTQEVTEQNLAIRSGSRPIVGWSQEALDVLVLRQHYRGLRRVKLNQTRTEIERFNDICFWRFVHQFLVGSTDGP